MHKPVSGHLHELGRCWLKHEYEDTGSRKSIKNAVHLE
jgi:hypothetical protein